MKAWLRNTKWGWPALALVAAVAVGGVTTGFGLTKGAQPQLWTEQSAVTAQAPTVQAPDWVKIGRELKPAVVNVSAKRSETAMPEMQGPSGEETPFDRYFKDFFGSRPKRHERSMGSGFIINPNGYIVTNNHVVDGATQVQVKLSDGRELPAKVVGRDSKTDIALLKVEASGLTVIPLGDSSASQVGEPVMAIGNPFGLDQTVTTGIVSATGRAIGSGPYDDFIQTDASINPGNSGGPLINARGQAIGINTAIFSQSGGSVGIGFAIPVNLAKPVLTQLASSGHVVRGYLGVTVQPVTAGLAKSFKLDAPRGALVSSVADGSPALKAGVKPGDVIVAYDGHAITRSDELPRLVAETPVNRAVGVALARDGSTATVSITIGQLADAAERRATADARPTLGLALQTVTPELAKRLHLRVQTGVIVRGVEEDSPAANAGLQPGDVIGEIDRQPVTNVDELERAIIRRVPGTPTLLLVHRDAGDLYLTMDS